MNIVYQLALHSLIGLLSGCRQRALHEYFGDPETAWHNPDEWQAVLKLPPVDLQELLTERRGTEPEAVYEKYLKSGAKFVAWEDPEYPERLRHLISPPYLLYYKGELPPFDQLAISIIGSRKATAYGRQVAEFLGTELARAGVWVISGLARGIDSCGHQGALAGNGKTVGVLGCGIDVIYPKENAKLYREVCEHGCVISEFPLGTSPLPLNFPIRNRIISGLADGVVVVEAMQRSGTQITVDYALEQGKSVFAVPGPIFSALSRGTHRLIRDYGIKLVTSAEDILEEFGQLSLDLRPDSLRRKPIVNELSPTEQQLVEYLTVARHFNEVMAELELDAAELAPLLTICELRGLVSRLDGQYYIAKNV